MEVLGLDIRSGDLKLIEDFNAFAALVIVLFIKSKLLLVLLVQTFSFFCD